MQIQIPRAVYEDLIHFCKEGFPSEVCGILIGKHNLDNETDTTIRMITEFHPLVNLATDTHRKFLIDPEEWTNSWYTCQQQGNSIIGLFHSHPHTPAIPSKYDLETLWHTLPSHWIVSFIDRNHPVIQVYRFYSDRNYQLIPWTILL